MMKKAFGVLALLLLVGAPAVQATVITPDDFGGPYCLSPAFGAAACGITTEYEDGGVIFDGDVAVFDDGVNAWGGINAVNVVDLVSPVNGLFVVPGTAMLAVTDFLSVEIGFAAVGSLLLEAFDINGVLLGSSFNDDGIGPHGRTLATLSLAGIHSFRVSGADTWGMDQIEFGELTAVPEPSTVILIGAGLVCLAVRRRRRSAQ
jgi:hypothetical protein